jgi:hypothetical protein
MYSLLDEQTKERVMLNDVKVIIFLVNDDYARVDITTAR